MLCYTYNKETPKNPYLIIMAPTLPSSRHICNQEAERKHTCKSGTVESQIHTSSIRLFLAK